MKNKSEMRWWKWALLGVLIPPAGVLMLAWLLCALLLQLAVWIMWRPLGRHALVVYSNSPIWQQYFEERILPFVHGRVVVLNWSDRKQWKSSSLAVVLFRFFGGTRNFNPIAIVFKPCTWARRFRFYQAFREFKHGHPAEVERLRQEFLACL